MIKDKNYTKIRSDTKLVKHKTIEKTKSQKSSPKSSWNSQSKKLSGADDNIRDFYTLGEEIGRGGFSIVYKGVRINDAEKVAVKVIHKKMIQEDMKLLKRELEKMKELQHPNIVKLIETFEDNEYAYIVMELVNSGKELFDCIVDRGFYSEKSTIIIIKQILEALKCIHEHKIIHRDIKPEKILYTEENGDIVVKFSDFIQSKFISELPGEINEEESENYSCVITPENLTGGDIDFAADMWGVGVLTYILLAGYPPFFADNDTELYEKVMQVEYDFEDPCWEDISESAKNFIKELLQKDPKERLTVDLALNHKWLS